MISRRSFVGALTGGLLAAPLGAGAQQAASPRRIGVLLNAFSPEDQAPQAFRKGLQEAGYSVGSDVVIEWRVGHGNRCRLPELAADLVQRKVDVIVADSTPGAQAAKNAISTIPIVLALVVDPVGSGLVASLQRPSGNVTGLSMMTLELAGKRLQLLTEAIPSLVRVGVLRNPDFAFHTQAVKDLSAAAPTLSIELSFADARTPEEFGPACRSANMVRFLRVSRRAGTGPRAGCRRPELTPQRKFEFRTPLAVGTLAVSGTMGRRMGGKCGTLLGLFSG